MPYQSEIIQQATARLERQRAQRRAEQQQLRQSVYDSIPELKQLDARLRAGMAAVAAAAFDYSADPAARVAALRQENRQLQARRAALIADAGINPADIDDTPACKRCDDRGWIGSAMCDCLKTLCAQEQIQSLSSMLDLGEQSFENFSLDWYSTEYDPSAGLSAREQMQMIYKVCSSYANRFGKFLSNNLFLTGAPGLGKTYLSACIARVVSEKGFSVVYDTAVRVFSQFEDAKFARSDTASQAVERYLNCDLLILDDLGSELTSQMTQSALYTLINTRLISDRHTVISSNLSLQEVQARYQPMIASRIAGEYRPLIFQGQDIRILRSTRQS